VAFFCLQNVTIQLTPGWPHIVVEKWVFTCVNLHFLPRSDASQGQPEQWPESGGALRIFEAVFTYVNQHCLFNLTLYLGVT